jgi:hypothetical protein
MREPHADELARRTGEDWQSVKRTWDGFWLMQAGPTLIAMRNEAMFLANVNEPKGKGYSQKMSALLKEYKLDDMEAVCRNDMLSIMKYLNEVQDWRRQQKNVQRLNFPTYVWRGFKKSDAYKQILQREGRQPTAPTRRSNKPAVKLDQLAERQGFQAVISADERKHEAEVADLEEQVADLQHRLDAATPELPVHERIASLIRDVQDGHVPAEHYPLLTALTKAIAARLKANNKPKAKAKSKARAKGNTSADAAVQQLADDISRGLNLGK